MVSKEESLANLNVRQMNLQIRNFKDLNKDFDIKTKKHIGIGSYGNVYEMKSLINSKLYALKEVKVTNFDEFINYLKEALVYFRIFDNSFIV